MVAAVQSNDAQENIMKLLTLLLAAIGLSGCVAYGGGTYATDVYYGDTVAYPAYGVYPSHGYYGTHVYTPRHGHRGERDRDRDGIPNRYDRDRDGDGVRNRDDRRPNNPRVQ